MPKRPVATRYDLTLGFNLKENSLSGLIKIELGAYKKFRELVLHAGEQLTILNGHVEEDDGSVIALDKVLLNKDKGDFATLKFSKCEFKPKNLFLQFRSSNCNGLSAFTRTEVKLGHNKFYIATSNMLGTESMLAFPCFGELSTPKIDNFSLTIQYDKSPITIQGKAYTPVAFSSNGLLRESTYKHHTTATFHIIPFLTIHQLGFAIGPLEFLEDRCIMSCTRVRVYTIPGQKRQANFVLQLTRKALDWFYHFFNDKNVYFDLNLVAIPNYKPPTRYHSFGVLIYDSSILIDESKLTNENQSPEIQLSYKQNIAMKVIEDVASQWFANEFRKKEEKIRSCHLQGIVDFLVFLCLDQIYPELEMWKQFRVFRLLSALHLDILFESMNHNDIMGSVEDQTREIQSFKRISLISMLHEHLGQISFSEALLAFIRDNCSSQNSDLRRIFWYWLEKSNNNSQFISRLISSWRLHGVVMNQDYPWIHVDCKDRKELMTLNLTQRTFSLCDPSVTCGKIPRLSNRAITLSIIYSAPKPTLIKESMNGPTKTLVLPDVDTSDSSYQHWVKLNSGCSGFYRTAYAPLLLSRLIMTIKQDLVLKYNDSNYNEGLKSFDRLNLLDDYYALCYAGYVSTTELLSLLTCFEYETEYLVWCCIEMCMTTLTDLFHHTKYEELFKAFCRKLYSKIYLKICLVTQTSELHTNNILRALVIKRLISSNDHQVIRHSLSAFRMHKDGLIIIHQDLIDAILTAVRAFGSKEDSLSIKEYCDNKKREDNIPFLHIVRKLCSHSQYATIKRLWLDRIESEENTVLRIITRFTNSSS